MKILFVSNRYPTAETPGDSPCIARQRAELERLGYEVDLLFIDSRRSRLNYLKAAWQVFWATQICRRYDVVHAHYGYYCGLSACVQFARPTIVTYRGSDVLTKRERGVSRLVAKFARQSIVMSEEMKDELGVEAAIVPYGIDLELFRPMPQKAARQELGLAENVPVVLFPYDPARSLKRFDLVEESLDLLRAEFPDIQVIAVWGKPYESVPLFMNACDVMVMTSDTEGAPVAIREAMACNLPIVSVDAGDVRDVIGTTVACSIAQRDPRDISEKVAGILRSGRRSNGRSVAMTMSVCVYARTIAGIYDRYRRRDWMKHPARNAQRHTDQKSHPPGEDLVPGSIE